MNCPCGQCRSECSAEFIGTFLLVFFGAGIVALTTPFSGSFVLTEIAATFGIVVAVVILSMGRISGAHINPAVSLAQAISGRLRRGLLLPYLFFQTAGGVAAGLVLRLIFHPDGSSVYLGSTTLSVSIMLGFALEIIGTFTLALVILRVSSRASSLKYQALVIGLTLFVLILALGPLTGASFNPARSLGPALASGHVDNTWLFLAAPPIGAALAAFVERRNDRT